MAWKNLKQRSLADSMLIDHDAVKELDSVYELIDWDRLEHHLKDIHSSSRGEKAWPPLMMFKALLLQSWYKLSDSALEKQLARDLLFRRFIALDISESVPDHSTFWRFRQKLDKLLLMDKLLQEINSQLIDKGLYIKSGGISIVDASVIEAKQCRPNKDKDKHSTQDPDAKWNVKAGSDGKSKSTYGYKAHINVDEDGLIKSIGYTAGNIHDSNCFTELLDGEESSVYADSAYSSKKHSEWLDDRNIDNRIIRRAYRNKPLTEHDKCFNRLHSGVRCTVERVFGVLKLHYGMAKARYLGLSRNRTRFEIMCVAHNIKRGLSIQQASCV
ncbi:MAG: IS5 family transposase [Candidatus Endonucleobacter bathymodioli]|uniref:IS5 family transposase n=2 Tax=Candidatus Endonucleibacter bathymodioli TaxID=539814 RepID=A0AA90NTS4_9GAMM|nr:IS5 family transposase [Candidatus Endonucleobacter bathymodioli]MDP0589205.1 IS5 family transposase [Candidatus Endonucleobacter bathymodioli]MDP0589782.1 IS5 family transposase [Candidatus Endonucleobacter bathymodioli]